MAPGLAVANASGLASRTHTPLLKVALRPRPITSSNSSSSPLAGTARAQSHCIVVRAPAAPRGHAQPMPRIRTGTACPHSDLHGQVGARLRASVLSIGLLSDIRGPSRAPPGGAWPANPFSGPKVGFWNSGSKRGRGARRIALVSQYWLLPCSGFFRFAAPAGNATPHIRWRCQCLIKTSRSLMSSAR